MKFANRLKSLRQEKGLSLRELAEMCETSKSAIGMYERGERRPKYETLEALADIFNVDMDYLLGKSDTRNKMTARQSSEENPWELELCDTFQELDIDDQIKVVQQVKAYVKDRSVILDVYPIKTKRLPLLGNVACGEPKYADEQLEAYVSADDDIDADFCLRAKGDSMINARIFDGDILFVKCQEEVDDGDIAVVLIDDETTVKRFYHDKENDIITLVPENPTYKPMRYAGTKLSEIRVLGKVIQGQYNII